MDIGHEYNNNVIGRRAVMLYNNTTVVLCLCYDAVETKEKKRQTRANLDSDTIETTSQITQTIQTTQTAQTPNPICY